LNESLINSAVASFQNGDRESFRTLYEQTSAYVFTIALRMLGQRSEAEEAMQEVYISVFRKIDSFRHDSAFRTWLYRIVMRECLDRLRHRRRHAEMVLGDAQAVDQAGALTSAYTGDPGILRAELRRRVQRALGLIHPELRSAFILRDIEGLTYTEIGEVLGCPIGTVSSRLGRARKQLAVQLTSVGIDETYFD
jgi:RNA polymerase sigma-70 factor, ECF subfamily